jgi:hypothetical protein
VQQDGLTPHHRWAKSEHHSGPVQFRVSKSIPAAEALRMAITAEYDYKIHATHGTVKWMRLRRVPPVWVECWRTSKAAVLPPSIDWVSKLP